MARLASERVRRLRKRGWQKKPRVRAGRLRVCGAGGLSAGGESVERRGKEQRPREGPDLQRCRGSEAASQPDINFFKHMSEAMQDVWQQAAGSGSKRRSAVASGSRRQREAAGNS
jgi:hypothetical protein